MGIWFVSGVPRGGLRSFDPLRTADLEYRMWVGYYLRRWTQVRAALVRAYAALLAAIHHAER